MVPFIARVWWRIVDPARMYSDSICLVMNRQGGNGVTFHGIVSVSQKFQINHLKKTHIGYCVYLKR